MIVGIGRQVSQFDFDGRRFTSSKCTVQRNGVLSNRRFVSRNRTRDCPLWWSRQIIDGCVNQVRRSINRNRSSRCRSRTTESDFEVFWSFRDRVSRQIEIDYKIRHRRSVRRRDVSQRSRSTIERHVRIGSCSGSHRRHDRSVITAVSCQIVQVNHNRSRLSIAECSGERNRVRRRCALVAGSRSRDRPRSYIRSSADTHCVVNGRCHTVIRCRNGNIDSDGTSRVT